MILILLCLVAVIPSVAANGNEEPSSCGQTFFRGSPTGTVSSPNSTTDTSCYYVIMAEPGQTINLVFNVFDLEESDGCLKDYLKVVDFEETNDISPPEIKCVAGRMCGIKENVTNAVEVTSEGHVVMIEFRSDNDTASLGFEIAYTIQRAVDPPASSGGSYMALHKHLSGQFSFSLPMKDDGQPVEVNLSLTLRQIVEVNHDCNRVTLIVWKEESWMDTALSWNLTEYNFPTVGIRAIQMWYPDTIPYNLVSKNEFLTPPTVAIEHTGKVVSVQAMKLSIDCDLDHFNTYTGAVCDLKMGSWTYNGNFLTFHEPTEYCFNVDMFSPTSKYEILRHTTHCEKVTNTYRGSQYESVVFEFGFRIKGTAPP